RFASFEPGQRISRPLPGSRVSTDFAPALRRRELSRNVHHVGTMTAEKLPELHLSEWRQTKDTLHLYAQIIGKIRLATTPPRNHWWSVPLYVDVRGLTTRRLHHNGTTFA